MKTVPLSKGMVAVVDDEDFDRVTAIKWHVTFQKNRGLRTAYAQATAHNPRRTIMMHRFVMGMNPGDPDIDHHDHDGLNNTRRNLRLATKSQNQANARPQGQRRLKGVFKIGNYKWKVLLGRKYIGTFYDEKKAAIAYNTESRKRSGEFAFQNPIE